MKFGLTEAEFKFLEDHLIKPIKEHGAAVFIFGSRANGSHRKFSDIDILYKESTSPIPSSQIYKWLTFLEESTFPYKVDLVKDSELAKSYRDNVEQQKIEL